MRALPRAPIAAPLRQALLGLLACAAVRGAPAPAPAADDWPATAAKTFDVVWSTVNDAYFDPTFGGVNWKEVGARFRARLPGVTTNDELRQLLQAMVGELHRTHFAIVPREMAVFAPAERSRVGTTGARVAAFEAAVVVDGVNVDSAAARAGLRAGTRITRVDGVSLAAAAEQMREAKVDEARVGFLLGSFVNARLRSAAGTKVELEGKTGDGEPWQATIVCEEQGGAWSEPIGNYPSMPVECETRHEADGIDYLRINVFAPTVMKDVKAFLRGVRPGGGLVVDLRGNPGGLSAMAPGIGGWLLAREARLGTMRLRKGELNFVAYPQEGAFLGPVAILIDGQSASTSEIFAAGLRDLGRARVFGERSAGAALPSAFRALPTGDLFQYAIGDVQTPKGASLEGAGVEPDERVVRTIDDLAQQRDAPLEAARTWLRAQTQTAAGATATKTPAPRS